MSTPNVKEIKDVIIKIKNIITNLSKKSINTPTARENYFWANHSDIMNKYPFLVSQLCSGGDMTMLDMMLYKLEQVEKGELNQDTADKEIGKQLADEYLPDPE
jgi:hypothetical protein